MFWTDEAVRAELTYRRESLLRAAGGAVTGRRRVPKPAHSSTRRRPSRRHGR